jgi:hypothetical protein
MDYGKCSRCGQSMMKYYIDFCPVCDRNEIIRGKHLSYSIVPMLEIASVYMPGFNKRKFWEDLVTRGIRNDTYKEVVLEDEYSEFDKTLRELFAFFNIEINGSVFLWVSW